ncbi:hypothetical protein Micbo1qcDRAFT_166465, partial [Microdochium bolleyi]
MSGSREPQLPSQPHPAAAPLVSATAPAAASQSHPQYGPDHSRGSGPGHLQYDHQHHQHQHQHQHQQHGYGPSLAAFTHQGPFMTGHVANRYPAVPTASSFAVSGPPDPTHQPAPNPVQQHMPPLPLAGPQHFAHAQADP